MSIDLRPSDSPFGEDVLETAFNNVRGELEALRPEELCSVNLEIMGAVNTAAGVLPEVKTLRAEMVEQLPKFDIVSFDKLPQYTMAAGYAHTSHLTASQPHDYLRPIVEEGTELRETLLGDATVLANRGLINGSFLNELKGSNGHKNLQADLQMLVTVLKANWPNIEGKCATTEVEIKRGEKLVSWLIQAVGRKEQGPAEIAKSADLRVRAFTLFIRTYNDARRAVAYLRADAGDVDSIIPSLYAGRSNGRKKESEPSAEPAPVENTLVSTAQAGAPNNGAAAGAVNASAAGGPFAQ